MFEEWLDIELDPVQAKNMFVEDIESYLETVDSLINLGYDKPALEGLKVRLVKLYDEVKNATPEEYMEYWGIRDVVEQSYIETLVDIFRGDELDTAFQKVAEEKNKE